LEQVVLNVLMLLLTDSDKQKAASRHERDAADEKIDIAVLEKAAAG